MQYQLEEIITPALSESKFNEIALNLFHFHANNNEVYKKWLSLLKVRESVVKHPKEIPFLPIRFFKKYRVLVGSEYEQVFSSSSTTGTGESKHYVKSLKWYETAFVKGFEQVYGKLDGSRIFSLLPAYAEREGSSLIYMVEKLQALSNDKIKHYLYNFKELEADLRLAVKGSQKVILIGVSFALLDFVNQLTEPISNLIVIETGGMKGRKKELTKPELHKQIKKGFRIDQVHSEYGMTELLSQAYQTQNNFFSCPPWMRVSFVDPQNILGEPTQKGQLKVMDLANAYSCPFILTDDIGEAVSEKEFTVLGRLDQSDLRGCSLLTA